MDADEQEEDEDEDDFEWTAVDRMRLWRHDALMQHLYETAAFWGDKVLSWTNDPNDAFWLAQTYFFTNQYSRAEKLLTRPFPAGPPNLPPKPHPSVFGQSPQRLPDEKVAGPSNQYQHQSANGPSAAPFVFGAQVNHPSAFHAAAQAGGGKGKAPAVAPAPNPAPPGLGVAIEIGLGNNLGLNPTASLPINLGTGLSIGNGRLPVGPSAMIDVAAERNVNVDGVQGLGDSEDEVSRLVDMSVACRYLAAQCQVRQGKWAEATEMLGEANPFRDLDDNTIQLPNTDGGIKIEASMCHLRGILMMKLGRGETAKNCFMEALALDVKCYDSFDQLVSGEMMTPEEEWNFVEGLAFNQQTPEDADFVRLIYTSRLRKYKHTEEHTLVRRRLVEEYGLADNPDLLYAFADALYAQFRWADCFAITSRILGLVSVHVPTMPLHLACMHHLGHLHSRLFVLAHELVDKEPESAISWYAVGVWYMSQKKWSEARKYFSKTSLMDPRFGPAWIAFAHTFSYEGEHDHCVTAYSTCVRMFPGSHLPMLFMGMEHIILANHAQAEEAFEAARMICDEDPLLYNERGVMAYTRGEYAQAAELFNEAIRVAEVVQGSMQAWAATFVNLGTCYRKLGRLDEAKAAYMRVIQVSPHNDEALAFLGIVSHLQGDVDGAILKYHESLSVRTNKYVQELLELALEDNSSPERLARTAVPPRALPRHRPRETRSQ
ncbi:TPR-like protein [Punctularia strigosozonata HHB-11173 SS5]|uniref:TPR-like protein n=1 Tax=Punctularia strigosozonata (strain HHB-11173) TaxID=741275 RepID=UPI000441628B|nr:TPR-like protein [Punctularia strigosozonata HHB-11173 SS5]EIN10021.1 TPR-like protein [Punctularia strigosozonata HHB-11173 SS5]